MVNGALGRGAERRRVCLQGQAQRSAPSRAGSPHLTPVTVCAGDARQSFTCALPGWGLSQLGGGGGRPVPGLLRAPSAKVAAKIN